MKFVTPIFERFSGDTTFTINLPLSRWGNLAKNVGQKSENPNFFYSNLYLHFLRPSCEKIFKIVKKGNYSDKMSLASIRSCLQFQWNRKYFSSVVLRSRG